MEVDLLTPFALGALATLTVWVMLRVNKRRVWRMHLSPRRQERVIARRFARAKKKGHDAIFVADEFTLAKPRITEIGQRLGYRFFLEGAVVLIGEDDEETRTPTYVYRR